MLRDIKKQSSGLGFKIIMGLIIISFVFWGVGNSLISSSNDSAAVVNGEKISITDFNLANQAQKNRLKNQFGDNLGTEYFDSENFKRGVMSQIVNAELLKQEAEKFDYDVSPQTIKEYIESSPGLQIEGKFSKEAYANYLAQVNKSAELLQRDIKEDIKGTALPKMVTQSAFSLKSEIENQYKMSKQKRNFDFVEISSKDYQDQVDVSEDEVSNYYKEFGSDFMTLEQVSVNYIELSTADLLDDIEVTDEEIQSFYDAKKETLLTAEKRKASHILLPVADNTEEVKSKIEKIAKRIADGEDFSEVAKEVSQDPGSAKDGGDLGWVAKGDMVEAFDEKLFAMSAGEISDPLLSSFGYHIIKLEEIKSPEIPTLESLKDSLITELKEEKSEELFLNTADELSTLVVDADNVLEIASEDSGLEIKTTELFSKGMGEGIAASQVFQSIAFSDSVKIDNQTSEMIDLGENHIAYIHIKEHIQPIIKPLDDVKDSIVAKLKAEKALELTKQKVSEYVEAITSGKTTLLEVATELEKTVVEAKDVERVGSAHPFNLVKNIFALKLTDDKPTLTSVESSGNAMAIVKLQSIQLADITGLTEDESKNISTQIQRTVSNNELSNITKSLRNSASINVNEKVFEDNL